MSVTSGPSTGLPSRSSPAAGPRFQLGDFIFKWFCLLAALSVPVLTVLMVVFLTFQALPAIRQFGPRFLMVSSWDKVGRHLGALPFVYGSRVTSFVAMVLAIPLGVGAAAYLSEIATGTFRRLATFLIELLAAIPSVVYGFWGLFFL